MRTIEPGELDLDAGVTLSDQRPTRPTDRHNFSIPQPLFQITTSLLPTIQHRNPRIPHHESHAIRNQRSKDGEPSHKQLTYSVTKSSIHLRPTIQPTKPSKPKITIKLQAKLGQTLQADKLTRVSTWQTYAQVKSNQGSAPQTKVRSSHDQPNSP